MIEREHQLFQSREREIFDNSSRLSALLHEMHNIVHEPIIQDPIIKSLFTAIPSVYQKNHHFAETVYDFAEHRKVKGNKHQEGIPPSSGASILRIGLQAHVIDKYGEFPQTGFDTPEEWEDYILSEVIPSIIQPPSKGEEQRGPHVLSRGEAFNTNILRNFSGANYGPRYGPIEICIQALANRWRGEKVLGLDVGTGIVEGPNQQFLKDQFPFPNIKVVESIPRSAKIPMVIDEELTEKSNRLLQRPSILSKIVAVDALDAYDPHTRMWSEASLRPESERRNSAFMERFNALAAARPDEVEFMIADFTDLQSLESFKEKYPGIKFNYISFVTMINQLSREEFLIMDKATDDLLADNGVKMYLDFIYLKGGIQVYDHWHVPGRYRLYMRDKADPAYRTVKVLSCLDSRCDTISTEGGEMFFDGLYRPTSEAIRHAAQVN